MDQISIEKITSVESKAVQEQSSAEEINRAKLIEVCNDFEQIFVKYLVDKMWSSADIDGGDTSGEKAIYQDMLNDQIAKEISDSSDLGISGMIYQQMSAAYFASASERLEQEQ